MSNNNANRDADRRTFLTTSAAAAVSLGVLAPLAGRADAGPAQTGPFPTTGLAANAKNAPLSPLAFQRKALGANDVAVEVAYCGICHTDVHAVRGSYAGLPYPLVPGHESSGVVIAVGARVSRVKVGDHVAVGVMLDSCGRCKECTNHTEQFCEEGAVFTYGAPDRDGSITKGGYATIQVAAERFVYRLPKDVELVYAAPLMCAGVTMYSALRHWNAARGMNLAVVGLGGLGHVGVMMAKAMGANVSVFTTSPEKIADARAFGASDVLLLNAAADFSKIRRRFDLLLDTSPERIDVDRLIPTLKRDATYVRVGAGKTSEPNQLGQNTLIYNRNSFAGTSTGGTRETEEMLAFCAKHSIRPRIQVVPLNSARIGEAYVALENKTARYRYVIDIKKT